MLNKIQYQVSIDRLVADTHKVLSNYSFNRQNQICFQNTKFGMNNVYEGTGDSRLPDSPMYQKNEKDFIYFNEKFKDTIFYDIHKHFPGRMRLANLKSKKCYAMHSDPKLFRYHFAIETNENCFILYRDGKHHHIPADGYCYIMNADYEHTALNAGNTDRIHLIISKNEDN